MEGSAARKGRAGPARRGLEKAPEAAYACRHVTLPLETPEAIDQLLENGELAQARTALAEVPSSDETYAVVRVKLGLFDGSMPAGAAQQALIRLMRRDAEWPGAKELYQKASGAAYRVGESSASHSHPPPPVRK